MRKNFRLIVLFYIIIALIGQQKALAYHALYFTYPYFMHPDIPWRVQPGQDVPIQFMVRFRDLNFGQYLSVDDVPSLFVRV